MMIVWDEAKRLANIAKHGLDFADLAFDFFSGAFIRPARQGRYLALGRVRDIHIVAVVFRQLGSEAISIVSMRPASRKERNHVEQEIA